ncbi:MAG: hypothetical protein KKC75_05805 [Nanoarchaeota archaeon]|nr:hypothetical protein [Nanoarchaeota archaeon]MBU1004909.1 hypothetical protein [Nanoarchaeota archaeon]MBU1945645.1 hypothetical protein [Nanoarchaeota archaeon]
MKLKPSKRPKKRYIVFEVLSGELKTDSAIHNAIKHSALNVMGNTYYEAGIRFLKDKYKSSLNKGILRVNNKYSKVLIESINKGKDIRTIGMSGILKKVEAKYLN